MNLAERLGYDAEARLLIVHADDVGVSHAANQAVFEGMEAGSITCGSILTPCPWFAEVADYCRDHPNADFGVHLTLTCEYLGYRWRPLADRETSPTLRDERGHMWRTTEEAAANVSAEDAARELRAQIDAALAAGIDVTHIDTHSGTVVFPKFIESYVALGIEYRLPLFVLRPSREVLESRGLLEFWDAMEPSVERAEEAGLPILDAVVADDLSRPPAETEAYCKSLFRGLQPGVTHFLFHPAKRSDELSAISQDAPGRAKNHELFRDGSMRDYIEGLGIRLIGYREIRDAYRAGTLKS